MTPEEIALVADLCRRRSGVMVDADKTYLIESRLAPVARREGFSRRPRSDPRNPASAGTRSLSGPWSRLWHRRDPVLSRPHALRSAAKRHPAAAGPKSTGPDPHLERGLRHRPGALFPGHAGRRGAKRRRRPEGGPVRQRPVERAWRRPIAAFTPNSRCSAACPRAC